MESKPTSERSEVSPLVPLTERERIFVETVARGAHFTQGARAAGLLAPSSSGKRMAARARIRLAIERRRFELSPDWQATIDAHIARLGELRDEFRKDGKATQALEAERLIGLALGHQPRPAGAQLGVQLNMPGGSPRDLPPGWADALARSS